MELTNGIAARFLPRFHTSTPDSLAIRVLAEQVNCHKICRKILLDAERGFVIAR